MEFLFAQISNIKKNYFLILVFVLFILINDAFILSDLYSLKCREAKIADSPGNVLTDENNKNIDDNIYVDVKGEVKKPGVYLAKEGMIVDDQTTPNMIQRISRIFERKPLISKGI